MVKVFIVTFFVITLVVFGNAFTIEPRIVRGYTAKPGQFPYYALLEMQSTERSFFGRSIKMSRCGATLISDQWLVTAAHCLDGADGVRVHLGVSQTRRAEPQHKAIIVGRENFYFPSMYKRTPHHFDMALIRLPQRVKFSKYIKPVRMPTTCETPVDELAFAMGFGVTSNNGYSPQDLQFAVLRTLPANVCRQVFPTSLWSNLITCAYDEVNYQSVCSGDSGGPFVSKADGTLIGVSSFVRSDGCERGSPQGFVNVFAYLNWISKVTGINLPDCS